MWKVGWPSPTIANIYIYIFIVINVIICVVIPYVMLVPRRHMWYLRWSLIVFLIAGTANKWCTLYCRLNVPAKISRRIGPWKVYWLSTWLYISTLKMRFVRCTCRMSALSKSFLFQSCKSKFKTRRFGVCGWTFFQTWTWNQVEFVS